MVAFLVIASLLSATPLVSAAGEHTPIEINSDSELQAFAAAEGWPGDGSEANPYRMIGYQIDGAGGRGLLIGNTTLYLSIISCVVRNCTTGMELTNVRNFAILDSQVFSASRNGIYLSHCTNGWVFNCSTDIGVPTVGATRPSLRINYGMDITVRQCRFFGGHYGIWAQNSNSLWVSQNTMSASLGGLTSISVSDSAIDLNMIRNGSVFYLGGNNSIYGNTFLRGTYGLLIEDSNDNLIQANQISESERGLAFWATSKGNRLNGNVMVNCSISFFGRGTAMNDQWISPNNTVNGKPVCHYVNMDMSGTVIPEDAGEIIFGNVTNAVVTDRAFTDVSVAVMGGSSPGIRVMNCSFNGIRFESIRLIDSPLSSISHCLDSSGTTFLSLSFNCARADMNNNTLTNMYQPLVMSDDQPEWGHILVADNTILGDEAGGMTLRGDGNRVLRNAINGSSYACIDISNGVGGSIAQNTISGGGIAINLANVSGLLITGNNITGAMTYGVLTWRFNDSLVTGNRITNSGRQGIWLEESFGNRLFRNVMIGNNGAGQAYNASRPQAIDLGANTWYENGSPHGFGNYWSDWTAPDNGTGIVQSAYVMGGGATDPFPLAAVPPTVPGLVVGLAVNVNGSTAVLTWSAPLNSGSGPVWGYMVYRNGVIVANNVSLTTYNVEMADGNNALAVCAFSSAGAGQVSTVQASRSSTPVDYSLILIIVIVVIGLLAAVLFMRRRK